MESVQQKNSILYLLLLLVIIVLLIAVSIYCYMIKYKSKQKYLLLYYVTNDKSINVSLNGKWQIKKYG